MHASCTGSSNGSFCLNQEWVDFINLETHVQILFLEAALLVSDF